MQVSLYPKACPDFDSPIVFVPSTMVQANGDPQIDCLEGFFTIMHNNPIAQHVRMIHYDDESRMHCDDQWVPMVETDQSHAALAALIRNFLDVKDADIEVTSLARCFRTVPFLRSIHVQEPCQERQFDGKDGLTPTRSSYFRRLQTTVGQAFEIRKKTLR